MKKEAGEDNIKTCDFIIVGQGLAGSVLALELISRNLSVIVIDKPELSSCSKVAAGIWNPVVFKRLTKSWMVDELLPVMFSFYRKWEAEFSSELICERSIIKFFSEQQEADLWKKKSAGEMKGYLDPQIYTQEIEGVNTTGIGYSKVLGSGNLDTELFLEKTRNFLRAKESFLEEKFDYSSLRHKEEISYKNIRANRIIFCEGYLVRENPFFSYVPFKPAKGEVLTIENNMLKNGKDILNKNLFVMPLRENRFKTGATYDWADLNDGVTEKGKREITSKLEKLITGEYKILKQEAGVRPSVIDRRPVLGLHPVFPNLCIFNGMGTKGVMLAPFFAGQMANFLQEKESLNPEVNVQRFDKFFVN